MTIKFGDTVRNIHYLAGIPFSAVWRVSARNEGLVKIVPFNSDAECTDPKYWRGCRFSLADFEKVIPEGPVCAPAQADEFIEHADKDAHKTASEGAQAAFKKQIAIRQAEIKSLRAAAKERAAKDAALAAELAIIRAEQERVQRRNDLLDADQELARATAVLLAEIYRLNNGGVNQPVPTRVSQRAAELQPLAKRHGYKLAAAGTLHVLTSL